MAPSRWARKTPRRRIPTKPRSAAPLFFSIISWTSRTRVRSISEADMSCAFSRRLDWRDEALAVMNAASYAGKAGAGKKVCRVGSHKLLQNQQLGRSASVLAPQQCGAHHPAQARKEYKSYKRQN